MVFEFNSCCCCIELRTGSLIIGYLSLVGNILLTLTMILGITGSAVVMHEGKDSETKDAGTVALVVLCIVLLFVIVNLIFNIVLLVGVHKYKRGHVKAYIVYTSIFIVLSIIGFIVKLATRQTADTIVSDLITICLSTYFLLCIRSYYLKMNDADKRPAIYNTA